MKRRHFLRAMGVGAVGAGSAALIRTAMADPAQPTAAAATIVGSERKAWARENFRGMENFVLPSFTADFSDIDEEGIRHDVRHAARQGFVSTMPMSLGLTAEERRRMLEVVADEAQGKILVTSTISGRTIEERVEFCRWAESLGVSQLFVSFSSGETEEAVYEAARQVIEATSLGAVLYGQPSDRFAKFDPCGLPMRALDRLADLPNAIAIKLTQVINPVTAFQVADLVSDRLLIGPVHLELAPLLASRYHVQWSGQWAVDALQSPEKPFAAEFMRLLGEGSIDEALKVYWAMQPVSEAFFELQAPLLRIGGHPWSHIKYYSWISGGNGGLLRDMGDPEHVPALDAAGRKAIRDAFASADIGTVNLPDEAFMVGTSAYERGIRSADLSATPQYVA
jgi:4-hydroxy-tetrahydrodipicolinate synthase